MKCYKGTILSVNPKDGVFKYLVEDNGLILFTVDQWKLWSGHAYWHGGDHEPCCQGKGVAKNINSGWNAGILKFVSCCFSLF